MRRKITVDNAGQIALVSCLGHGHIQDLTWSPDGKTIALVSSCGVWLYSSDDLQAVPRFLKGHGDAVNSVRFSPDGRLLASGDDEGMVRLWDALTGHYSAVLKGHRSTVTNLTFSPDGRLLASADDEGMVRLWIGMARISLVQLGHKAQPSVTVLKGHNLTVTGLAFSPDSKLLASASLDRTLRLWDVQTQQCVTVVEGHTHSVISAVAFSPDGTLLAAGTADGVVRLWSVEGGS